MRNVTCSECGWVHFAVTREFAEAQVAVMRAFMDSLSPEKRREYYGPREVSIRDYECCNRCGESYKNMRPYRDGDCPDGCTIGPTLENV